MRTPLGQFVFGFVIAFSPAPLIGFGTWTLVHAKEAAPGAEVVHSPSYGTPLDHDWSRDSRVPMQEPGVNTPEDQRQYGETPQTAPQKGAETDCAKRKRKAIPKRPKPEREIPDL
ncbi:MAG: hypothetical protein K8I27_16875 [Planctomycetes bacterium]|nr:hypothetical protein [Planctomycetota bacterium]